MSDVHQPGRKGDYPHPVSFVPLAFVQPETFARNDATLHGLGQGRPQVEAADAVVVIVEEPNLIQVQRGKKDFQVLGQVASVVTVAVDQRRHRANLSLDMQAFCVLKCMEFAH
ncbi:hypothetical protein U3649_11140 [Luteimonas sp. R10]|nr:hypothetical protein U3649_11140 [Luteimonas sp. R10]